MTTDERDQERERLKVVALLRNGVENECGADLEPEECATLLALLTGSPEPEDPRFCDRPPDGWACSRERGHVGPCAPWPTKRKLDYAVELIQDARRLLQQGPPGSHPLNTVHADASLDAAEHALARLDEQRGTCEPLANVSAEHVARLFHEHYERKAAMLGYETRGDSRVPWADVPDKNKVLMISTATAVLADLALGSPEPAEPSTREQYRAEVDALNRRWAEPAVQPGEEWPASDMLGAAWALIASLDWEKLPEEWVEAAKKWGDIYHVRTLATGRKP